MMKAFTISILLMIVTAGLSAQTTLVGNTTFDFQSYWANHNRLLVYPDGKVSTAWVGSDGFGAAFNDRGMFYNHFNGTSWGAFPSGRLEDQKTYFGELLKVMGHEVVISDETTRLLVNKNSTVGATDWTETAGSNVIDGYNPMAFCPEGTDDIYVVNTKKITYESLLFSRSDDGGETWAVNEYFLPFTEEAYGIELVNPDCYQIVVHGNDVYVLYGANFCDLILMHSPSKGDPGTWTSQTLVNFPIDNYTGAAGQTSDYDGDGDKDTIYTTDGMHEMIITDDGTVHVFSGRMRIYDPTTAAGYYYIPKTSGIYYWHTGMASATVLDVMVDWNNDDGLDDPYAGLGSDFTAYYAESVTTMPTACYDPSSGRVYLMFMMPVEYEISAGNQTYYDIFGCYSDDGGTTWTSPVNITYTAYLGHENAYASAFPKVMDGKIHLQWQQDEEPGTTQDSPADDIVINNILYNAFDPSRFDPYNPTVDFTYTLIPVGMTYSATFTNLSVDAEEYYWEFGDGGTSTLENPTHIYAPGIYNVCLTGYNVYGETTVCEEIIAMNEPVADFTYIGDPEVAFIDLSTGSPAEWYWDFGDGFTSTESDPVHTFSDNGVYNVCLTVTNGAGSDTHCENVTIDSYVAPTAYWIYSGDPTVTFTDLSIGSPTSWSWDFDDGFTSAIASPVHTYAVNGTYHVCLTVSNGAGTSTSCQDVVIDSYLSPVVDFSFTGDPTVSFTDLSTNSPTSWDWDFDDGTFSTVENPVHTFPTNGSYNVCLTATNGIGSGTDCKVVVINGYAAPVALFSYSGDPVVSFTDLSTGTPTSWFWDFDDGAFSTVENPVHTYATDGIYSVCLTVTGPGGVNTGCQDVTISSTAGAPTAAFSYINVGPLTIKFTDLSTNAPTDWSWDFGDGSISGLQNPSHTYANIGEYNVCLTASNGIGEDTYCEVIFAGDDIQSLDINHVIAYPNPASSILNVNIPNVSGDHDVSIINMLGQKLPVKELQFIENILTLNIAELPAGNYMVLVHQDGGNYITYFTKEQIDFMIQKKLVMVGGLFFVG